MRVVIDTSSLLSLVRYYLPFDNQKILYRFIEQKVKSGEIVVIDKVYEECRYVSRGIVVEQLDFLSKKFLYKTAELLPSEKFFRQLENQFINGAIRKRLTDVEFENRKNSFLQSADTKLLLYSLKYQNQLEKPCIVTEETETSNDNKSFKKLPAICKILHIDAITLPELLKQYKEINLLISR